MVGMTALVASSPLHIAVLQPPKTYSTHGPYHWKLIARFRTVEIR
jgi:hypothetical protein